MHRDISAIDCSPGDVLYPRVTDVENLVIALENLVIQIKAESWSRMGAHDYAASLTTSFIYSFTHYIPVASRQIYDQFHITMRKLVPQAFRHLRHACEARHCTLKSHVFNAGYKNLLASSIGNADATFKAAKSPPLRHCQSVLGCRMFSQKAGSVVSFPLAQTGEGISECELTKWFVEVRASMRNACLTW